MKALVYQNLVDAEEDLVALIVTAAGEVRDNAHDVQRSLVRRMELCRQGNSGHFEHILSLQFQSVVSLSKSAAVPTHHVQSNATANPSKYLKTYFHENALTNFLVIKTSHRCLIDLRTRSQTPGVLRMSSEHANSEGIPNQAQETNKPMILNGPTSRNREGSEGERGGQAIGPPLPIHRSGNLRSKYRRAVRLKCCKKVKRQKLPSICVEGKPRRKTEAGNLSQPGFEPGPALFTMRQDNRYSRAVDSCIPKFNMIKKRNPDRKQTKEIVELLSGNPAGGLPSDLPRLREHPSDTRGTLPAEIHQLDEVYGENVLSRKQTFWREILDHPPYSSDLPQSFPSLRTVIAAVADMLTKELELHQTLSRIANISKSRNWIVRSDKLGASTY
ncbi:hypothetical protein ANN_19378 [Periplaneta americana]|uniref:Uncharacterized protein n=1 Tax=Periplaneta americana TaxID=6978 RepID=A0ABQ8SA17_PERAM|nr:hypothetical protein ANN_19378 [Periplaneta americana]